MELCSFPAIYFPGGSDGKASACNGEDLGLILGSGRFPRRRKWQPTLVLLPEKSHGWRSLVGYSPWGCKESDTNKQLHFLNYGGSNEDSGDLLERTPRMHDPRCPQPCSRPPPALASTGESWTLTGKPGSVSCGVTAPFSWVLVHKVLFVPSKSLFSSPV